ncbi:RTA1 like protein-domain-containing protein [Geopyxis carbonaria]|nr:RTA1 like protein-domain-containing protein [Geopyxis carbonaria]
MSAALHPRASAAVAARGSYYVYTTPPSTPLALAAAVLFGLLLLLHLLQLFRHRSYYFAPLSVAAAMETLGYATRVLSLARPLHRGLFICQFACVVLAPVLIAAAAYILFGRLMEALLPGGARARVLRIPARAVTALFLTGDVASFVMQGAGAGVMTGASDGRDPGAMRRGQNIMVAGLGVQVAFFAVFSAAVVRFDGRTRGMGVQQDRRWRWLLWALYVCCLLILVRSLFRVVEFAQGWTGWLARREAYFYGLEALPMLVAVALFNVVHPGRFLPVAEKGEGSDAEGPREEEAEGEAEGRGAEKV